MYLYLYVFLIKYGDDSAKDNNASNVKFSRLTNSSGYPSAL